MVRAVIVGVTAFGVASSVFAAAGGETTANFLTLGVGGRAVAMGEAYAGLADDVNSMAYNPGAVARLDAPEISAMHAEWFEGMRYEYLAYAHPTNLGVFGGDARAFLSGPLELRTDPQKPSPEPEGTFSAADFAVDLNYAYPFSAALAAGVNAKAIYQNLYDTSAFSCAGDAGVYWAPFKNFGAGLAARNLGPDVKFAEKGFPVPMSGEIGLGYKFWRNRVVVAAAAEKPFKDDFLYKGGLEFSPFEYFSGRVGYIAGLDTGGLTGLTAGLGVNIAGFNFDLAYAPYGDLGSTYRAGFTYAFGREKKKIVAEVTRKVQEEFDRQRREMIAALSAKADAASSTGDYEEAVETWDLILVWDPDNQTAADKLQQAIDLLTAQRLADHIAKGEAFFAGGKYNEAALEFTLAQKLDPTNAAAIAGLARAQEESAKEEARHAARISKLMEQARTAYGDGDYAAAMKKWQEVLLMEPDNAEARASLDAARSRVANLVADLKTKALKAEGQRNWGGALIYWRRALALAPEDEAAIAGKSRVASAADREVAGLVDEGVALYNRGDLNGAEGKLLAALNVAPDNARASAYLARVKNDRQGKTAPKGKADYTAVYLKGIEAYTNHKYRAAIAYWEQIPAGDPYYSKAVNNIRRAKTVLKELESR